MDPNYSILVGPSPPIENGCDYNQSNNSKYIWCFFFSYIEILWHYKLLYYYKKNYLIFEILFLGPNNVTVFIIAIVASVVGFLILVVLGFYAYSKLRLYLQINRGSPDATMLDDVCITNS